MKRFIHLWVRFNVFRLLGVLLLVIVVCGPATAKSCWPAVASNDVVRPTLSTKDGHILKMQDIPEKKDELTPGMIIFKALSGIDHFSTHPDECIDVFEDSLNLLQEYILLYKIDKTEEMAKYFAHPEDEIASGLLRRVQENVRSLVAQRQFQDIPARIAQNEPGYGHSLLHHVVSQFREEDLSGIQISCQLLLKSTFWRSVLVTKFNGRYDVLVFNVERCTTNNFMLENLEAFKLFAVRRFGFPYLTLEEHISNIITEPARFLSPTLGPDREPLWRYFSVFNWLEWEETLRLSVPAQEELKAFYQSVHRLGEEDAHKAAERAIKSLPWIENTLPIPVDDIRVVILRGGSLGEVEKSYKTRRADSFDGEGYRFIDNNYYKFRDICPHSSYDQICDFDMYYDVDYRWSEHLALIGTPEPPLLIAILRPDVVGWLLDAGEDIEQVNQFGKTALMTGAHANQEGTVQLLLKRGADVNRRTYGEITIDNKYSQYAWGYRAYLDETIRKPRSLKHAGRTALMYAAENADAVLIDMLLDHGADPCLVDSRGLTPQQYFSGLAPSGDSNQKVTDPRARERITAALSCPTDRHIHPAPFATPVQ